MGMVPERVPPVERNKAWHEKTPDERYGDIIRNWQDRHKSQVDSISRLVSAVRFSEMPVGGTVVLFKLDSPIELAFPKDSGDPRAYLEIKESTVDDAGRVIITLQAVQI